MFLSVCVWVCISMFLVGRASLFRRSRVEDVGGGRWNPSAKLLHSSPCMCCIPIKPDGGTLVCSKRSIKDAKMGQESRGKFVMFCSILVNEYLSCSYYIFRSQLYSTYCMCSSPPFSLAKRWRKKRIWRLSLCKEMSSHVVCASRLLWPTIMYCSNVIPPLITAVVMTLAKVKVRWCCMYCDKVRKQIGVDVVWTFSQQLVVWLSHLF